MISGVRRIARSEHLSVFAVDSLAVVLPRGQPDVDAIEQLEATLEAFAAERQGSIVLLIVVSPDTRPPSGPARDRAREMFGGFAEYVSLFATVIEGAGFLSAAKRSVFTFVSSILRGSVPGKVFADQDEALAWIEDRASSIPGLVIPGATRLQRSLVQARADESSVA